MSTLKSLFSQSIDVIKIIMEFSFYNHFQSFQKECIELPNVLQKKATQCCVYKDNVYILIKLGYWDLQSRLVVFSITNQNIATVIETFGIITDFAVCSDKLIVALTNNNGIFLPNKKYKMNNVNFFTLSGKFEYGFNIPNFDNHWGFVSICDIQNVIYVFDTEKTHVYAFNGQFIEDVQLRFQDHMIHKRDKNGNANFKSNPCYISWIQNIIEDLPIYQTNSDLLRSGHVSKYGLLFLNDSNQIHIYEKISKVVAKNSFVSIFYDWLSSFMNSNQNIKAIHKRKESIQVCSVEHRHQTIKCCALDSIGRLFVLTDNHLFIYI